MAKRYLEVGVKAGRTFEVVRAVNRVAVDPYPAFDVKRLPSGVTVHRQTSNAFFAKLPVDERFDMIFLDGLHQWFQTYEDVLNAFRHLSPGGVILMDDVVPCDGVSALPSIQDSYRARKLMGSNDRRWHGDVFRTLFALNEHHKNISFRVIDAHRGNQQAVLWCTETARAQGFDQIARKDDYNWLSYEIAFENGSEPEFFKVGDEAQILNQAIEAARA